MVPTSVSYYEIGTVLNILHVLFNFHNNSKIITTPFFRCENNFRTGYTPGIKQSTLEKGN